MQVVRTRAGVRQQIESVRRSGRTVGLVPTMGYLHEGHLSLVDRCRALTDFAVLSIYVNPLQFGPDEDFDQYPRDLTRDLELAEARGVDLVFAPADSELYPSPPAVVVVPKRLADRLCGRGRPGHFEGVLTVVTKLFNIVAPDVAVFGRKDFQQSVLIRRMVADLNMPLEIEVAPTVREPDGLALSSRNEYLSSDGRTAALSISRGLIHAVRLYQEGERAPDRLCAAVRESLEAEGGVERVEYVECVDPDDLEPAQEVKDETVIAVAAHVGGTRLIDNVVLGRPDPGLEDRLHLSGSR